jgi:Transcriptional regulators
MKAGGERRYMSVERTKLRVGGMEIIPVENVLRDATLDGNGSLTQQVYRLVRALVASLTLLPNQFLSEKDVAASLNISKTPVREAFIRLAEDEIVRIVPKSGTYVAPVDTEKAMEGMFIWTALECSCAAQAAEYMTIAGIGRLRGSLEIQKTAIMKANAAGFDRECDAFHDIIFDMADLPDARKLIEQARFEVDRILCIGQGYGKIPMDETLADHSAIVNAIGKNDGEEVRSRMAEHMGRMKKSIAEIVASDLHVELLHFLNQKRPGTRRSRAGKKGKT